MRAVKIPAREQRPDLEPCTGYWSIETKREHDGRAPVGNEQLDLDRHAQPREESPERPRLARELHALHLASRGPAARVGLRPELDGTFRCFESCHEPLD